MAQRELDVGDRIVGHGDGVWAELDGAVVMDLGRATGGAYTALVCGRWHGQFIAAGADDLA